MDLNVLYFAHVRARTGVSSETITVPDGLTAGDVVAIIVSRHPDVVMLIPHLRIAVDGEFVGNDAPVPDGAEFVLIPPVAGGSGTPPVALVEEPLDHANLGRLSALVSGPAHGAVATFAGVVRNHARGKVVTRLYYEAYATMATNVMRSIVGETEAKFPGVRVAVHHRVGMLEIGDVAVQIAAGSAHRAESFDACRWVIDRLKQDCPIWKREIGPDGEEWVSERP